MEISAVLAANVPCQIIKQFQLVGHQRESVDSRRATVDRSRGYGPVTQHAA